jgi:hypothetical protein
MSSEAGSTMNLFLENGEVHSMDGYLIMKQYEREFVDQQSKWRLCGIADLKLAAENQAVRRCAIAVLT